MKKAIFLLVLVAMVNSGLATAQDVAVNLSTAVRSAFHTDFGFLPYENSVSQSCLVVSYRGWRAVAVISAGLGKPIDGTPGNEVDVALAYNSNVRLGLLSEVNVDTGVAYFDFAAPGLGNLIGDFVQPFVEIKKTIGLGKGHSLVPGFRVEVPLPLNDGIAGAHFYAGVGYVWKMAPQLSFHHDVNIVGDTGAYGLDSGVIFLYRAGLEWQISDRLSLSPSLKLTTPVSGARDRKTEISGGGALNLNFKF